ncbi:lipase [Acanthamoeba castellanii str. Neff]|uniref:sn-1-specific diacylglycerol lipase n=1 Tax=Acanthamoeba castellanii (strain ATCC 30010 / Neff) TaxID=1257118 RepID=L8GMJ0_ACACF|nr:lipase [Acanthamoeba castellanii str. Neff]ELR14039.1 lipase [Acanthamoeba castellanii str. Neff]
MEEDREGVGGASSSSLLYNPFAGVVSATKSLLGVRDSEDEKKRNDGEKVALVASIPEIEHHHHDQQQIDDKRQRGRMGHVKESSFDEQPELITVDLDALPAAVVFGPRGHVHTVGSNISSGRAELRRLKEELAVLSAADGDGCSRHRSRDDPDDDDDDDDEQEEEEDLNADRQLAVTTQSWAIFETAKAWLPTINVQAALSSVGSSIKYSIISPQTEETFGKIAAIVSQFFADVEVSYSELIMGLMLLSICQRKLRETIRTDIPVTRAALEDGYYYMRFAAAVYGWQLIYGYNFEGKTNGLFKGLISGDSVNPQIVAAKTGIDEADLITTQWDSKDFNPGHYMAYDHSRKTVVIAIRGTFHLRDALTDLVASYEPFEDGVAHCGILHTAQKKLELLEPFLIEALRAHPDYGLVIVGHSLGAGAASLLTILLHNISLDLAKKYRHLITSYVMGDDLVPRLSYGSMEELKGNILIVLAQEKGTVSRMFKLFAAGNALGNAATKKLEKLLKCNATLDIEELQQKRKMLVLPEKLWPPGVVYHMYMLPKKTWSNEARERQRKQEQDDEQKSHRTPEEAIMEMIMQNEQQHKRRQHSMDGDFPQAAGARDDDGDDEHRRLVHEFDAERAQREAKPKQAEQQQQQQHEKVEGESGEQVGKWSDEEGKGKEKKDELPPRKTARRAGQKRYAIEESAPSLFSEIIVSGKMFSDHFPDVYENVLKALVDELEEEDEEEARGGAQRSPSSIGVERDDNVGGSSEEVQLKKADLMREYAEGKSILRKEAATTNVEHDDQPEEGVMMNEEDQEKAPQEQREKKDEEDEDEDGDNGSGDGVPRPLRD